MLACVFIAGCVLVNFKIEGSESFVSETVDYHRKSNNITPDTRFLLFDTISIEGFNIRREVYRRAANLIKILNSNGEDWVLVLPQFKKSIHWQSADLFREEHQRWSAYFDLASLRLYGPVMEFHDFWDLYGSDHGFNHILLLQKPEQNGGTSIYIDDCKVPHHYIKDQQGFIRKKEELIYAQNLVCVTVNGIVRAYSLADILQNVTGRFIFVDQFDGIFPCYTHGQENVDFAFQLDQARRSLVFAKHLREEADKYRAKFLNSNDLKDKTKYYDQDWRQHVSKEGEALGGPYFAMHLRRTDFLTKHKRMIPTIKEQADEAKKRLREYGLKKLFLATDGTEEDVQELQSYLENIQIFRYPHTKENILTFSYGGVAIIEQWIAAHARYFLGTVRSTFTQRIQEERDILGFSGSTTYNEFCTRAFPKKKCPTNIGLFSKKMKKKINSLREEQAARLVMNKKQRLEL